MIELDEARSRVMETVSRLDSERVSYQTAQGQVLAEDLRSGEDIPPFDKSAMDGYALRADDAASASNRSLRRVDGGIAAGGLLRGSLPPGMCIRIMTGAPVPRGADAVAPLEDTRAGENGFVRFEGEVTPGQNVCTRGEDVGRGDLVAPSGTLLGAPGIAACASIGAVRIPVIRRPTVCVLPTGNEIVEAEGDVAEGRIRNSNGPMLLALLRSEGVEGRYLGIGTDDRKTLRERILRGLESDMLLVSGGVSMGDYDLVPGVLEECGARTLFHRVRVKPGKPLLFARTERCVVFGIPGNPVSNFTTFHLFVKPALRKMMGREDADDRKVTARLTADLEKRGDRTLIVPVSVLLSGGECTAAPLALNGSADIIGCIGCNGLVRVDEARVEAGRAVEVILLEP